jgi:hypothetical protein
MTVLVDRGSKASGTTREPEPPPDLPSVDAAQQYYIYGSEVQAAVTTTSGGIGSLVAANLEMGIHRSAPLRRSDVEVHRLFRELAAEWRTRTALDSNIQRKVLDHAYQRIIGLGPQVVPCILDDLARSPDHWFWALTALVGQDVAAGQMSVRSAAEAWLAWGRQVGIVE